jgi:tubulin-specific chaperone B
MADIPLFVVSDYSSSERRITPSWSIAQFKTKMETVTGIPPSAQRITYKTPTSERIAVEAADEDNTPLSNFPLARNGEIQASP